MAVIVDGVTQVGAKVSAAGSLLVSTGDDGLPTYFTPIYHPRLTVAIAANGILWAIRAPLSRTLVIQGGRLRLGLDTTTTGEVGVDMVRFQGGDPAGGNLYVPARKMTADPDPQTIMVRSCTATSGLTATAMTVDPANTAFFRLAIPFIAGSVIDHDLTAWVGMELGPGEGLALATRPAVAPIGLTTSGWLEFSEKVPE